MHSGQHEPDWHKGCTWCWRTIWHMTENKENQGKSRSIFLGGEPGPTPTGTPDNDTWDDPKFDDEKPGKKDDGESKGKK